MLTSNKNTYSVFRRLIFFGKLVLYFENNYLYLAKVIGPFQCFACGTGKSIEHLEFSGIFLQPNAYLPKKITKYVVKILYTFLFDKSFLFLQKPISTANSWAAL